ncbi:BrnT family toxin [Microvirga pudoricolor]|uniref:BrnT family toxin n=1 Tax=Microvirga pudoricolor TaxID=2778729 RepID=UPI001950EEE2|nr:BrnT family toxin [Microvirga pudoricolor]MBM6595745.1 BrnT family toxin [Microvirga pudoricolor]
MFEWDEAKDRANVEKHGVGFATASKIFERPVLSWIDKRFDYGEIRQHSIGMVDGIVCVAVIHADRAGRIRIISARRANRAERRRYEEALRQRAELPGTGGIA